MFEQLYQYVLLMRLHKPIGIFLLLWPTWWALWLAAAGQPDTKIWIVFTLGVILMRSAGCIINDIADRKLDPHVKRTANRPIASGKVSVKEALILFVVLSGMAFSMVCLLDVNTILMSFVALPLAATYPFMKRYTPLPQVHLGLAFGWAIPMAFMAQKQAIPSAAWLLYIITIIWVIAYDTMYAMADRADDLKIGIKSSAILFAQYDKFIVALLQALMLMGLYGIGIIFKLNTIYFYAIGSLPFLFIYQQKLIYHRDEKQCLSAFLNNHYVGLIVWLGIFFNYYFQYELI